MAMMELSVVPVGTGRTSVSSTVADIVGFLRRQKGVSVELSGMGTTLTGPAERLFRLASKVHALPFRKGVRRVYTVIKLDDRRDKAQTPADKVHSVLKKLR